MKIQVLGSGCPTCKNLYELTKKAVHELALSDNVEYVTDITKLVEMGIMTSPVLAIDGKAAIVGFVPDIEKIKDVLKQETTTSEVKKSECSCGGSC